MLIILIGDICLDSHFGTLPAVTSLSHLEDIRATTTQKKKEINHKWGSKESSPEQDFPQLTLIKVTSNV